MEQHAGVDLVNIRRGRTLQCSENSCHGNRVQEFLKDLGVYLPLRVHTDSSAASGIAKRVGLGTQHHIGTDTLWVQERLRKKPFRLFKVKGTENPADLFTKHLCSESMVICLRFLGTEFRRNRPRTAPMTKDDEDLLMDDEFDYDLPNDDDKI